MTIEAEGNISEVSSEENSSKTSSERMHSVRDALEELSILMADMHEAESLVEALYRSEDRLLRIMEAERITIYQKGKDDREIISKYMSGATDRKPVEVRVRLNTSSIAGYVALSQRPILISNVNRSDLLKKIHPLLKFNDAFDKKSGFVTESVIAIPIRYREVLLGVLQVLNRRGGGSFTRQDFYKAELVARHLAQRFRFDLQGTDSPFKGLVKKGVLSAEEIKEFETQATKEGISTKDVIIKSGKASKKDVGASLEQYYQVPFMEYDANIQIPHHLLSGISPTYLRKQTWVPIEFVKGELTILIDDPSNAPLLMEIQRTIPADQYILRIGFLEDIQKYLAQIKGMEDLDVSTNSLLRQLETEEESDLILDQSVDLESDEAENEATVIKLVNQIIKEAAESRASDIHIEPGKGRNPSKVRVRVDGACRVMTEVPASYKNAIISRIKIMSNLDISERRKPQDGKITMRMGMKSLELRVATIPTVHGEGAVLRILASGEPLPLDAISLTPDNFENLTKMSKVPYGLLLVVGPTGSGKTTTLHAVLGSINDDEKKIWTAEDPVEITQRGLQQVAVQPKIGFTFAAALRSFLRADPDIVMIGEMRDYETAHIAVEASLTGHLVLSTLHTNSAPETVTRLLDLGLDPASFSDAMLGILAQRLVRTLCPKCKEMYIAEDGELETIVRFYGEKYAERDLNLESGKIKLYRARGCDFCGKSGYRGRMGVHELLSSSIEMRKAIYHKATVSEIRELAMQQGMRTLMQDGIIKMLSGHTDLTQVRKVATSV